MNVGFAIRDTRLRLHLSQAAVEQRTGIRRVYLSRIENGHTVPSIRVLEDLCVHGFFMRLSEFFRQAEKQSLGAPLKPAFGLGGDFSERRKAA